MKYDVIALKQKLLVKYPFFGNVIANAQYEENENIKTAETDGKTIYYNPLFLAKLEPLQQVFVLAHEVCHIAFNHIVRSYGKDSDIWNIATDAVINSFLKCDGLKMTDGAIDISDAINYDAEELYELLLKHHPKEKLNNNNHSMWKNIVKKNNDSSNNSDLFKTYQQMGEQEAFKKNLEDKKRILEDFKQAIINNASRGTTTYSSTRKLTNIGVNRPLIDWRYILRETTRYEVDYSYKNAIIEDGVIMANLEELPMSEVEIVLDTSGSVNELLLKSFLKECKNILKYAKLKIGCFDTKFYGFNEINGEEDIDNMQFIGGGGTDFNVAIRAFTRRVANKIIFTDGEAPIPNKSFDAIWIVFSNKAINPKGGKVFYVNEEELSKENNKVKKLINN